MYSIPVKIAMKAHRNVAILIPNVCARSGFVVNDNPRPLYLRKGVTLPIAQECGSVRMGMMRRKTLASNRANLEPSSEVLYQPHSLH